MPAAATRIATAATAQLFHALSDETRLGIIERLLGGERCVCELTDDLDAAQSRLSFHLRTLKEAGIVTDRREGRWVYYALNRETIEEIEAITASLHRSTRSVPVRGDACCG